MTRVQLTDEEWEFIAPYLSIGEYGPYPERLRQQREGVIWRFKTSGQWREMPQEFGAWPTVSNRFRQWRDAGVFEALLEGLIAEAAKRGEVDLSLVSIDSTTARAHHDAAGIRPLDIAPTCANVKSRPPSQRRRIRQPTARRRAPEAAGPSPTTVWGTNSVGDSVGARVGMTVYAIDGYTVTFAIPGWIAKPTKPRD